MPAITGAFRAAAAAVLAACAAAPNSHAWPNPCTPSLVPEVPLPIPGDVFSVDAMLPWDPDGPGPKPESVLISPGLRVLDQGQWLPICPEAWTRKGSRHAVVDSVLYATGTFTHHTPNGSYRSFSGLARWDAPEWTLLVPETSDFSLYPIADALHRLLVITLPGGSTMTQLHRLAGTEWQPVPGHPSGSVYRVGTQPDHLGRVPVFLADSATSYPTFTRVALYDGVTWTPVGTPLFGRVEAAHVFNGSLFVAGDFFVERPGARDGSSVARWTGTDWEPVGGISCLQFRQVHDLNDDGARLILTGSFECAAYAAQAGDHPIRGSAFFDGVRWRPLGRGWNPTPEGPVNSRNRPLFARLFKHRGVLYAHGTLRQADEPLLAVARLSGDRWESVGIGFNAAIRALSATPTSLFAGGDFTNTPGGRGGGVARFDGARWHPVGAGVSGWTGDQRPRVAAIAAAPDDTLTVAGLFTHAGASPALNIARFDGQRWSPLAAGLNGAVRALALHQGGLVAAGDFTASGSTPLSRVGRWNGVAWTPMGTGADATVRALLDTPFGLIAAGDFTTLGGAPAPSAAAWDGVRWNPLGAGLPGATRALAMHQHELFAAGEYRAPATTLMKWNGAEWTPESSINFGTIRGLASFNANLYPAWGGSFDERTGWLTTWINAALPGPSWGSGYVTFRSFDSGTGPLALAVFKGDLHIGGGFHEADGTRSPYWARMRAWERLGPIDSPDAYKTHWPGTRLRATIEAPNAISHWTTWRLFPDYSVAAIGPTLEIDPLTWADQRSYIVELGNPCDYDWHSFRILLYPDINEDGVLDSTDLRMLLARFGPVPPGSPGDMYANGRIDTHELLTLVRNFGLRRHPAQ